MDKKTDRNRRYLTSSELDIVIPVYNEGGNIKRLVEEIHAKVNTPYRIVIVYDFDEDDTLPIVYKLRRKYGNIELMKNAYGKGALNAIKTGLYNTNAQATLVMMADLSDDPIIVDRMFQMVMKGFDVVCASRYMKGGRQVGGLWLKRTLSKLAGISLHWLAGIPTHDITNSYKMYSNRVLNEIKVESDGGFEVGMEMVIKAHFRGFKVGEIECTWRDNPQSISRFKMARWIPKYMKWYIYALKMRVSRSGKTIMARLIGRGTK